MEAIMRSFRHFAGVLLLLAFAAAAFAQDWRGKGRVDGWVKDPNGQPISDAKVELSRDRGGSTSTKTNKKGYWAIMGLAGGAWNVDVSAPGFETRKVSVQIAEASRIPAMDIQLQPAAAPAAPQEGAAAPGGASEEAIAAIKEGNRLIGEKKYAEARALYEKALAAVPDNPAILKGIAQTYQGEGNKEKAIEILNRVKTLDPSDSESQIVLASLLLEKGDLDAGKAILDALPPESLRDPSVFINIGILFMNKKQAEEARTYLTKAIEIDPANADGYYYRGLALLQSKKNAEAKADLQKFLELKPDAPEAAEVREILQSLK
jgi:tetratricopeptide (TPR) repeat protein